MNFFIFLVSNVSPGMYMDRLLIAARSSMNLIDMVWISFVYVFIVSAEQQDIMIFESKWMILLQIILFLTTKYFEALYKE